MRKASPDPFCELIAPYRPKWLAEKLAEAGAPTSRQTIYGWQTGTQKPNVDNCAALARVLKVDFGDLMRMVAGMAAA